MNPRLRKAVRLKFLTRAASSPVFLCVAFYIGMALNASAASPPNSWTNKTAAGFWQDTKAWSLGTPPSTVNQSGIFITNTVSKIVTINSSTPSTNRTINDFTLAAPSGFTNALQLTNAGTATPLLINNGFTISSGCALLVTNSFVMVAGGSSGQLLIDGSVTVLGGGLITTTNAGGSQAGTLTVVGNASSGSLTVQGGSLLPNKLYMGLTAGSRGTFTMSGGETKSTGLICAGCRVGSTGAVWVTGGQLSASNGFLEVGADGLMGQMAVSNGTVTISEFTLATFSNTVGRSLGTLTMAGGSLQSLSSFTAGSDPGTTGIVWVTGGQIGVSTSLILGYLPSMSFGGMTISNGAVTATLANIGNSRGFSASLALYNSGVMTVYSNMLVGYCPEAATGSVLIAGGSLYVSNDTSTAVLDLSGGTLTLSSGLLYVDTIVITNTCAKFVLAAPPPTTTLLYTSSILSSNLDADGDGLPNYWEVKYGLGPLNPFGNDGALGDPDGDFFANLEEYNGSTDPTNSNSHPPVVAIAITTSPVSTNVCAGVLVSFKAAATGAPAPSLQWQANSGSGFTNIPGAASGPLIPGRLPTR